MVSTPLKNISQNGNLPLIGVKIKNIWNQHPGFSCFFWRKVFRMHLKLTWNDLKHQKENYWVKSYRMYPHSNEKKILSRLSNAVLRMPQAFFPTPRQATCTCLLVEDFQSSHKQKLNICHPKPPSLRKTFVFGHLKKWKFQDRSLPRKILSSLGMCRWDRHSRNMESNTDVCWE